MSNCRHSLCAWAAVVPLAIAWPAAGAQCDTSAGRPIEVVGRVIDARALSPVRARMVVTAGSDTVATLDADSAGFFSTMLCRRAVVVAHFRRAGYRPDSLVVPLDTTRWTLLDVAMVPLRESPVVALAESRVSTVAAIVARVRRGGGVYVGADEIERMKAARTSDILRGRRGIALENVNGVLRVVSARSGRPRTTPPIGDESCPLRIGVNGHLMAEDYRIDDIAPVGLAAIEIYPSATSMPIEFTAVGRSKVCGMVMLWTHGDTAPSP